MTSTTAAAPRPFVAGTDLATIAELQQVAARRRLEVISLGAGVQSTTLALMAAKGELPRPDVALFADTGWEPRAVYDHLARLEAALPYPVLRVSEGNLRDDLLNPGRQFAAIPYFTQRDPGPCGLCAASGRVDGERCTRCNGTGHDNGRGVGRRQCTGEYKLTPIRRALRVLLGASAPDYRRVPTGRAATQWVGFSTDEVGRANRRKDSHGVQYLDTRYPLLEADIDMSRADCERWLRRHGWEARKSACIGCPFHGNRQWRELRDHDPAGWADAIEVDRAIRRGGSGSAEDAALNGEAYLHRSFLPLEVAPIDRVTRHEWRDRQLDIFDAALDAELDAELEAAEEGRYTSCSPYGCDDGEAVA